MKQITLHIPMYAITGTYRDSRPIDLPKGINYVLFAGFPGSGINGGRPNINSDDSNAFVYDPGTQTSGLKTICRYGRLLRIRKHFYNCVEEANSLGIPVSLTFTNYFPDATYWDLGNARAVRVLKKKGKKHKDKMHGKNSITVANPGIESWAKDITKDSLDFVCSCTSFYNEEKILTREERLNGYRRKLENFDLVVITPPETAIPEQLEALDRDTLDRVVGVAGSPCVEVCNSYWHYAQASAVNILTATGFFTEFSHKYEKMLKNIHESSKTKCAMKTRNVRKDVHTLLNAGIPNIKIGRFSNDTTDTEKQVKQAIEAVLEWQASH
ncbi:hypothetical protein HOC35_00950 [Candidatus Woesearchaeota archaeon]|jgi:hypothetical protein|nr:hypothetical protein [Candidatus Woesearchaeota archaeon]